MEQEEVDDKEGGEDDKDDDDDEDKEGGEDDKDGDDDEDKEDKGLLASRPSTQTSNQGTEPIRADWGGLRMAFMQRFGARETSEKLWERLCEVRLVNVFEYGQGEVKVKSRFPVTFEAAREVARLKERKLRYQLQHREMDQEEDGLCLPLKVKSRFPVTFEAAREVARLKERKLSWRICQYILSEPQHHLSKEEVKEGNRKTTTAIVAVRRDIKCTFAPTQGGIQTIEDPDNKCHHQEADNNNSTNRPYQCRAPPVQILRPRQQQQQPPPPPAPIPPLPPVHKNRAVSIINLVAKGKAKVEEEEVSLPKGKGKGKEKKQEKVDAMPIKRARQEETADSEVDTRRKTKESAKSSKKKKTKPRQKLTIKDFSLGESSQPYDLVDDVSMQGPKISWPQLLYLSPKVCRQWSKMVSTRRVKTKAMGLVFGKSLKDIVPVVDAYVKGQRISNVYEDGGAQICVISEHVFHRLGLKISAPAPYKAKMANNVKVECLKIVNAVRVKVCEVEVEVDVYVMPTKEEGYPIILGRPWLMAMQARQDWGIGMLELSPHKGSGMKTKVVRYDMKIGKQGKMKFETSVDEFSSSTCSTTTEKESTTSDESDSSGEEVMGLILTEPNKVDPPNIARVEESKLAKMLAKDLTKEEKQAYLTRLEDFPRLFIEGYDQITGVTVVQYHIKLKEGSKPTVQWL
ncbi:hypothetical protein L7F22_039657 [Adiantum nelumboides]|nr:hypothetical protein [Adiantum nelumboides]